MNDSLYTPLIAGIDTLEIGYCVITLELSEKELQIIETAKESAQATSFDKGTAIKFRGYDLTVLRTGSRRYKYILSNEDFDICLNTDVRIDSNSLNLKVRFKSQFLWRNHRLRARHHHRHQRTAGTQGREDRAGHHRGLPRHAGDRPHAAC